MKVPLTTLIALAAASSLATSCDRPAPAPPERPAQARPLPQLCDSDPNPDYPNGFLVVWAPNPLSHVSGIAGSTYAPESVPKAIELYRKYNRLVAPLHDRFVARDLAALKMAAKSARALAEETRRTGPPESYSPISRRAEDLSVQALIRSAGLQIAFMILTLDEDYGRFRNQVGSILDEAGEAAGYYRFREASSPTRIGEASLHTGASPTTVRSVLMYRLLNGDWAAAERSMIYLLERGAATNPEGFFFPYETERLRARLRGQEARFDELVFGPPAGADAQPKRCSDLYAFYVEWLDLASRAVVRGGAEDRSAQMLSNVQRLRGVPPSLVGPRYSGALDRIEKRLLNLNPDGSAR